MTVFYGQVSRALRIHDELDQARQELDELKGIKREPAQKTTGKCQDLITDSLQLGPEGSACM